MKFNLSLALLASAVIAQGTEKKEAVCANVVECKIKDLLANDTEFAKKVEECAKGGDTAKKTECTLITAKLTPEQVQVAAKLKPASDECFKSATEAADKSTEKVQADTLDCLAKKAKLEKFDSKKSVECSKKCIGEKELTKSFDCDYKCNEDLYKGLGAELKASDKKDENKDEKKDGDKKDGDKKDGDKKDGDKKDGDEKKEGDKKAGDKKTDEKKPTSNANRVQLGSLNLVTFALPLAYLFLN